VTKMNYTAFDRIHVGVLPTSLRNTIRFAAVQQHKLAALVETHEFKTVFDSGSRYTNNRTPVEFDGVYGLSCPIFRASVEENSVRLFNGAVCDECGNAIKFGYLFFYMNNMLFLCADPVCVINAKMAGHFKNGHAW
jgi:hypothetical protein